MPDIPNGKVVPISQDASLVPVLEESIRLVARKRRILEAFEEHVLPLMLEDK